MAEFKMHERDLMRRITVTVRLVRPPWYRVRLWVGRWLMGIGARLMGMQWRGEIVDDVQELRGWRVE